MQPVDTGGPIIGRHDLSKYSLSLGDSTGPRIWYLDVFESDTLFVDAVLRGKACTPLVVSSMWGRMAFQADSEGIFLVGKLVNEVTGVTPEREVV